LRQIPAGGSSLYKSSSNLFFRCGEVGTSILASPLDRTNRDSFSGCPLCVPVEVLRYIVDYPEPMIKTLDGLLVKIVAP